MAMTAWSTVAANNVLANTGINCDEGMAPSAVNDSIREIMAVLKTAIDTGNMTATGTTFNLVNATATTVNFAGAATTVTIGAGAASTLNANFTTAINLNTAAIVSNQTTVAVVNTNATTVNAFGAASVALNIGHASAAAAFPGGISIPTGKSVTGAGTATVTGFATVSATSVTVGGAAVVANFPLGIRYTTGQNAYFGLPNNAGAIRLIAGDNTLAATVPVEIEGTTTKLYGNNGAARLGLTVNNDGTTTFAQIAAAAAGVYLGATQTTAALVSQSTSGSGTTTHYIGNQTITTSSDIRLKENVVDSQRDALGILNKLRVVDHTWNDPSDPGPHNRNSRGVWTGLIAQEAHAHIPWLVNKPPSDIGEDGKPQYWFMDYGYAVPFLIKAIQQLDAKLEAKTDV